MVCTKVKGHTLFSWSLLLCEKAGDSTTRLKRLVQAQSRLASFSGNIRVLQKNIRFTGLSLGMVASTGVHRTIIRDGG